MHKLDGRDGTIETAARTKEIFRHPHQQEVKAVVSLVWCHARFAIVEERREVDGGCFRRGALSSLPRLLSVLLEITAEEEPRAEEAR
jgi:hypothetical protein